MLDRDLAGLYGVTTAALNQAVRRNRARFPPDFMFQLNEREFADWRSQIVMSNLRRNSSTNVASSQAGMAATAAIVVRRENLMRDFPPTIGADALKERQGASTRSHTNASRPR